MYHADVTRRVVEETGRRQGWPLQYHSIASIDDATSHFEELFDTDQQRLRRPLTTEESRWIQNERKLCALDFNYWSQSYGYIVNFEKTPQRFTPNIAQEIELQIWGEFEVQARAIHVQNLKARRLGISTICELAVQHRFQFHPFSNCVIASADPGKSFLMADMIDYCWSRQPWWLLPKVTAVKKGMPAECGEIHTGLTIQAGNQFNGVARGATPSVSHLSELAEWVDAESLVDAALYRAIIDTPNVFCMLESTAEGRGNWWHRTWEQNKKDWARGRGRVRPVFLPWYVGVDLYPPKQDLRVRPAPTDWSPSDRTIRHAERAKDFVLHSPTLFKYLAKSNRDWRMSRAQMWWYECEYETALDKKELNLFFSELPSDDIEAFQSEAISVISQEVIISYRERVREPEAVYTILGSEIPTALTVSRRYWDASKPPLTIRTTELTRTNDVYQLQPVQWDGYLSNPDPALRLIVWEHPEDGDTYGIGVDTSDGVGEDNTVCEVIRKGSPSRPPAQVAEFASPYIKAFQLWPIALALGCRYSTYSMSAGRRVQCRIAIECRGNGESTQFELQKRGWQNFHPWKRYDSRKRIPDGKVTKLGVFTAPWWRSQMMDYILTLIDEECLDIPSQWLVEEMASIERDEESQKAQAAYGEHDDRFMALGFILFSLDVDHVRRTRYADRRLPSLAIRTADENEQTPRYAIWRPSEQGRDTGRAAVVAALDRPIGRERYR